MKKFSILIAILVAFAAGWVASDKLGSPPLADPKAEKGDAKNGDKTEDKDKKDEDGKDAKKDEKAIPVAVKPVIEGDISSSVAFNTSVTSEQSLDIHSEIEGIIASIEIEEGDIVKQGDPLLTLVNDDHRIQKEESKANLDNLENEFARAQNMLKEELITTQEFETKRYEYTQARLQFERDDLLFKRSIVRAPFGGLVTERFTQTGARITPTTQLFHIVNTDELIARVFVPEKLLHSVKIDQPVIIQSSSVPDVEWKGSIKRISPNISIETGTFKVTIGIEPQQDQRLPTGLFVSARVLTSTHEDVALIPKQAIVYENDRQFVFIVEDQKAVKRLIEPGISDPTHIQILSEMKPGELVIVQGQVGLKDKAAVKIVGPAGSLEAAPDDTTEEETKTAQSEEGEEENAS